MAFYSMATIFAAKSCNDFTLKQRTLKKQVFLEWRGMKLLEFETE
jgi:hypothetical protein